MIRRTTIDLDTDLVDQAKRALGLTTTRAAVEEALRRAAAAAGESQMELARLQRDYFKNLERWADLELLASGEMWR